MTSRLFRVIAWRLRGAVVGVLALAACSSESVQVVDFPDFPTLVVVAENSEGVVEHTAYDLEGGRVVEVPIDRDAINTDLLFFDEPLADSRLDVGLLSPQPAGSKCSLRLEPAETWRRVDDVFSKSEPGIPEVSYAVARCPCGTLELKLISSLPLEFPLVFFRATNGVGLLRSVPEASGEYAVVEIDAKTTMPRRFEISLPSTPTLATMFADGTLMVATDAPPRLMRVPPEGPTENACPASAFQRIVQIEVEGRNPESLDAFLLDVSEDEGLAYFWQVGRSGCTRLGSLELDGLVFGDEIEAVANGAPTVFFRESLLDLSRGANGEAPVRYPEVAVNAAWHVTPAGRIFVAVPAGGIYELVDNEFVPFRAMDRGEIRALNFLDETFVAVRDFSVREYGIDNGLSCDELETTLRFSRRFVLPQWGRTMSIPLLPLPLLTVVAPN